MIRSELTQILAVAVICVAMAAAPPARAQDDASASGMENAALYPRVKMETSLGDIVIELNGEKAPISTLNFLRYAEEGYYNGTIFHRVMPGFMIQGGGFTSSLNKKTDGLHPGIKNEWTNRLRNYRGTISMARLGGQPDSGTSQFFINVVDNPALDKAQRDGAAYAVFGKVVEGIETVDAIRNTETEENPKYPGGKVVPVTPVVISHVSAVGSVDKAAIEALIGGEMRALITRFNKETGLEPVVTPSGLVHYVVREGDGASPTIADKVKVHYRGVFTDGGQFDSSYDRDKPTVFGVTQVIAGWTEGLQLMKVGGESKFIIPSDIAYGANPPRGILPNSILIFDVELLEVIKK